MFTYFLLPVPDTYFFPSKNGANARGSQRDDFTVKRVHGELLRVHVNYFGLRPQ